MTPRQIADEVGSVGLWRFESTGTGTGSGEPPCCDGCSPGDGSRDYRASSARPAATTASASRAFGWVSRIG
jgi:hypothetical protein